MSRPLLSRTTLFVLEVLAHWKSGRKMPFRGDQRAPSSQGIYLSPFLILSFYVYESRAKTLNSENHVVARGVKAIGFIYHLTGRVPSLISQSHLEKHEGMKNQPH